MIITKSLLYEYGDRLYTSEYDVYIRHILTYKVGPRAERVIQINYFWQINIFFVIWSLIIALAIPALNDEKY